MRIQQIIKLGLLTVSFLGSAAMAQINGVWETEKSDNGGYLHVQIDNCGDKTCGTIYKAFRDGNENTSYEHLGKQLIWGMQPAGENLWKKGSIWAPDKDKTYKSKMLLSGSRLKVSGCVLGGLICRAQTWKRVQ